MCVFVVLLSFTFLAASEQYVVNTAQGRLRGEANGGYISFKGVPYASISSPDHRFKRAGLAPSWQGVREPDEVVCSETSPAEHCLRLDVHAPLTGPQPRPVLAWLAGARLRPDALLAQGIIVVIIHHRVGPQGFLCLGEDMIPGNAGVKDVVLGLRWIRDNIVAFKGDAAKVVMAGQGFGAAVAEAVMLSPMASSLYHGVILQSGTALAPWAFNYDAKERAINLAETLSTSHNLSATLLTSPIDELVDKSNKLDAPYFPFGICIETAMTHEERSVSEPPFDTLSSKKVGKVPMIIGYNKDEAYIFASILSDAKVTHTISRNIGFLLPEELKFINDREMGQVAKQVEDIYFKTDKSLRAVLDYYRDAYFVSHIHRSARLHASTSQPVYFYQFSHSGERGVLEQPGIPKAGAAHSDELAYLFAGRQLDGDDGTVQTNLVKLWTNFVKYLDPTLKESTRWEALDPAHPRLLDIGTETAMVDFPPARAASTWDNIYDTYYYSRQRRAG